MPNGRQYGARHDGRAADDHVRIGHALAQEGDDALVPTLGNFRQGCYSLPLHVQARRADASSHKAERLAVAPATNCSQDTHNLLAYVHTRIGIACDTNQGCNHRVVLWSGDAHQQYAPCLAHRIVLILDHTQGLSKHNRSFLVVGMDQVRKCLRDGFPHLGVPVAGASEHIVQRRRQPALGEAGLRLEGLEARGRIGAPQMLPGADIGQGPQSKRSRRGCERFVQAPAAQKGEDVRCNALGQGGPHYALYKTSCLSS
mmetsp:Transcript_71049/g.185013  ORF Transcript_71049/g.185013 Transcript_71049/m.185013 type:complete len:257 (-) Transcript_71049:5-775(-)